MNTNCSRRGIVLVVLGTALLGMARLPVLQAAPTPKKPQKPPVKAKPKPKPAPAKPGIKQTPQMAGSVGRFGELYGLKSGWTFQIIGARYSYEPFDDYGQLYPDPSQKLLILQVAIKNNTPADLYFGNDNHQFQLQDSDNQVYSGGAYRLSSAGGKEFSPSLKPGQGKGQVGGDKLEVAIPVANSAKITKIILKQGRKGTSEDVMRFFVAGTEGGDAKNVIASASVPDGASPIKPEGFYPSSYYDFRINGVTFSSDPIAGNEVPENRRYAIVNITVKNPTSIEQNNFDFLAGAIDNLYFTDGDGERYPASSEIGVLKGSADETSESNLAPGQEKTLRVVFPVPQKGELKTLVLGSAKGKPWTFDASQWK